MVGKITMLLKRKTPMMEMMYPPRLHSENPSCQPGTSISDGMRKTSQITMVLARVWKRKKSEPDGIQDGPCSCANFLCDVHPREVEEGDAEHGQHKPDAQGSIVSQLRKSVKILQIKRSHRHLPGQIHQWSLQKGRSGREPSPRRRASSQREQEVWRGWQNLSQRNNDESDETL